MSGQSLYGRICRVTIATPISSSKDFKTTTSEVIEIEELRVQFSIKKTAKKEPNTSEIKITNLSPDRRKSLQAKGVKVMLEAGYKDTGYARYFVGDVRTVDHVRSGADWETVLHLGDGARSWQFARVNDSWAPGTPQATIMKSLAGSLGLDLGNVDKQAAQLTGTMDTGWCASGSASREFGRFMDSMRLNWSVQDGEVLVLKKDEVLNSQIEEIRPDSGLIGSPEMGSPPKKGQPALLTIQTLLAPAKIGEKKRLKSERYDGEVKVVALDFDGDTAGGNWYRKIHAQVLK